MTSQGSLTKGWSSSVAQMVPLTPVNVGSVPIKCHSNGKNMLSEWQFSSPWPLPVLFPIYLPFLPLHLLFVLGGKSWRFSREKKIAEESIQSGNLNDAAHSDGRGLLTDRFIIVRDSKTTSLLVVNSDELSFTCITWECYVYSQHLWPFGKTVTLSL